MFKSQKQQKKEFSNLKLFWFVRKRMWRHRLQHCPFKKNSSPSWFDCSDYFIWLTDPHGDCPPAAPEMSPCVRSRDCEEGLCCALYLTGRRCQRVPALGEVCLLRGRAKFRRRLERCDCDEKLFCRAQPHSPRGQGVCHPDPRSWPQTNTVCSWSKLTRNMTRHAIRARG